MVEKDKNRMVWRGAVTGLSYLDYGLVANKIKVGSELFLMAKENQYDPRAVSLYLGGYQVAWIPKQCNTEVRQLLDDGVILKAIVTNHDPEGDFSRRLFVNVYRDPDVPAEVPTPTVKSVKENTMSNINSAASQSSKVARTEPETKAKYLFRTNLEAGATAGFMEAGRIANNQTVKFVAKKVPMMVRGYVDTPFGKLLVANMAVLAAAQFRPDDQHLGRLVEAMQVQAYQEMLQMIKIEEFLDELMDNPTIKRAMKAVRESPAED